MKVVFYTVNPNDGESDWHAVPTLKAARQYVRDMGFTKAFITKETTLDLPLRELVCRIHNHSSYADMLEDVK